MRHGLNDADRAFRSDFEAARVAPGDFDHRAHVRLAYVYLAEMEDHDAGLRVREALRGFLEHHGVPLSKYHETMTRAWLLAVRHFMVSSHTEFGSAAEFIEANPRLLDSTIMLRHYSADLLFSDEARAEFVPPDLDEIPRHGR